MKIAYFDCFSGISGDMIIGSLIDAGFNLKELKSELAKLKLTGYKLKVEKTTKKHITGTKFSVDTQEKTTERKLGDILEIIKKSDIDGDIKDSSKKIFRKLAEVEAKIHNIEVDKIHFHEVGGLDSIIDVIGSLICLKGLDIDKVYSSKIHVGCGFVECQHGTLPIPAPATVELLKGIPIYSKGIKSELVTPTGAAIIRSISERFGDIPDLKIEKIGYGAGANELNIPNLLRVFIGEIEDDKLDEDKVVLVEANIDDMNPEFFDYISETLQSMGSLDVFMTPIIMKKNRPATMLSVLADEEKLDGILSTIFTETTSLGVRIHGLKRKKLERDIISVKTKFGTISVKVGKIKGQIKNLAPEYEDCKNIAAKQKLPLKDIYDEAKRVARKMFSDNKV